MAIEFQFYKMKRVMEIYGTDTVSMYLIPKNYKHKNG